MDIERKIIEDKINQAFDDLIVEYKEENIKLLKTINDLQIENKKLKNIILNLVKGNSPSKIDFHFHKIND